jgi:hypothetical protein
MASDSMRITSFPDSGSPERVAFDLMKWLQNVEPKPKSKDEWLDFYAQCLRATSGLRSSS